MSAVTLPFFGNLVLCATLVVAAYTFAMALGAGRGRPHMLVAARFGTYATCAFVALAILVLAFAFQTHDFRIRYVARYSDRSMEWWYLLTSLWGGQDGSLLWWAFLLCGYTAICTRWMRGRYLELQPYVLATLMSILMFFLVLMLFAANPFSTYAAAAPMEGEGLNPLLQNYWMTIHPPTLYLGFIGWSIPFAFVIAALITGRLHEEWVRAVFRWTLVTWLFLSIGLLLGMLWSYEELGWGGYWAWDPVENASFMPWLVGTAFLHSVLVQERLRMLKVWNVFLLCLTFIMTIFGTFLTRAGLIASVHSFAKSEIGIYFVWYLVFLIVGCAALIVWRLPRLKAEHQMHALLSREFAFLVNNWILIGMMVFVLVATTFPLLSEWIRGEQVTVGPGFYNKWMAPLGLVLLFLLGAGPLIAWRKASGRKLARAFIVPTIAAGVALVLHLTLGNALGFAPYIESDAIYETTTGRVLAAIYGVTPLLSSVLCSFVIATIAQEFWRGTVARRRAADESWSRAFLSLMNRARRRYGGYIVHLGMVLQYVGFTGAAYDVEKEAALHPGESMRVGGYTLEYKEPRTAVDRNKRMVFADMVVRDAEGALIGSASPAKFVYRTHPDMPTTEVDIRSRPHDDLYVIMSTVDPESRRATFRVIVRPLVMWIWIGGIVLIFGSLLTMWPSVREILSDDKKRRRKATPSGAAAVAAMLLLALFFIGKPASVLAQSDSTSSLHAGTVEIKNAEERRVFERLLCQCGDCARLPLNTCGCGWAENMRAQVRARMKAGESAAAIITSYREEYGPKAISIPADKGLDRALWAVPVTGIVLAAGLVLVLGARWRKRSRQAAAKQEATENASGARESRGEAARNAGEQSKYDARIEDELRRMEGD